MYEYKVYNNKKLIYLAFLAGIIYNITYVISMSFSRLEVDTLSLIIMMTIISIVLSVIIFKNRYDFVKLDDEKIESIRPSKVYIQWSNIKLVTISDWYIKILTVHNSTKSIYKRMHAKEEFEELKNEIISRTDADKIVYIEPDSPENFKRKGWLSYINFTLYMGLVVSIIELITVAVSIISNNVTSSFLFVGLNVFVELLSCVFYFYIIILFKKMKRKVIKYLIAINWFSVFYSFFYYVVRVGSKTSGIVLTDIINLLLGIIYSLLVALITIEYIKTSYRVKKMFVK